MVAKSPFLELGSLSIRFSSAFLSEVNIANDDFGFDIEINRRDRQLMAANRKSVMPRLRVTFIYTFWY